MRSSSKTFVNTRIFLYFTVSIQYSDSLTNARKRRFRIFTGYNQINPLSTFTVGRPLFPLPLALTLPPVFPLTLPPSPSVSPFIFSLLQIKFPYFKPPPPLICESNPKTVKYFVQILQGIVQICTFRFLFFSFCLCIEN